MEHPKKGVEDGEIMSHKDADLNGRTKVLKTVQEAGVGRTVFTQVYIAVVINGNEEEKYHGVT